MQTVTQRLLGITTLAWSLAAISPAWAQMHGHGSNPSAMPHGQQDMPHGQMGQAAMPGMTDAEVRRIDQDTGKITLRHGEIRHLDMPPMTMVFNVQDKALLERVKVGDKVRFQVEMRQGQMVVTDINPAP